MRSERLQIEINLKVRNVGNINKRIEIKTKVFEELTKTKGILEESNKSNPSNVSHSNQSD